MPSPTSPATAAGAPTAKRSNPEHPVAELLGSRRPGCPWRRSRRSPANQAGSLLGLARDCLDRRSLFQRPTTGHSYAHLMGVAFVAHCLLNQNSKVGDGAHCAGVYSPVIDTLRDKGWRIEQMPCPELAFTGLNRFWAVREQLDTAAYRRHCARLAEAVAAAISVRAGQG